MNTPLTHTHIAYLGSSVTYGSAAGGHSFVECIAERNGNTYQKEAVSGTTLVDNGPSSYVARLKTMDTKAHTDLFVCQLSTNDAARGYPLGENSATSASHDTQTICGALAYIIEYAHTTWRCPVVLYTNCYYASEAYAAMVAKLYELAALYPYLHILDMYTDTAFNDITAEQRKRYMHDPVHPTLEGYQNWWTPHMEAALAAWV